MYQIHALTQWRSLCLGHIAIRDLIKNRLDWAEPGVWDSGGEGRLLLPTEPTSRSHKGQHREKEIKDG